ncbi:MAG TPA: (2Fe-2S) ferredoxin domain-containing protein [Cytophagales bacterium]|nr:(2Fe-2S) ferredoxin domain-containing protein [Cytophagales bacterium]
MKYKKHIFVCVNERSDGRKSCGEATGMALVAEFKRLLQEAGLNAEVRAQKAGCLDVCAFGPVAVVYPEGIFYKNLKIEDIPTIIAEHIANDRPVEHLKINFKKQ